MFEGKTVAVVVPCYNEETQVGKVIQTMPDFVDCILVVDDVSKDRTREVVRAVIAARGDQKVVLLEHAANAGVGAAIVTGYKEAIRRAIDVTAVMAGDGQMPPEDLHRFVAPVARGLADYAKANRLFYQGAWEHTPPTRYLGNAFLSMLTKIASGYWHVGDSQTGYTAISLEALETINLGGVYPRYGYPNDLLCRLNIYDFRVADIHVRPTYHVGERSKMKLWKVVPTMSWLIFKRFCLRMKEKYIIHDFHPLVLFYLCGTVSFLAGLALGLYLLVYRIVTHHTVAATSGLFSVLLLTTGLQMILFGMWFDMEVNRHLKVDLPRDKNVWRA